MHYFEINIKLTVIISSKCDNNFLSSFLSRQQTNKSEKGAWLIESPFNNQQKKNLTGLDIRLRAGRAPYFNMVLILFVFTAAYTSSTKLFSFINPSHPHR